MHPIVTFDSTLGGPDENGRPKGLTQYHGKLSRKPQRWRVVVAALNKELKVRSERDIRPLTPVALNALIRGTVLPMIDEAIADARDAINIVLGVDDSQGTHEISTEFQVWLWR